MTFTRWLILVATVVVLIGAALAVVLVMRPARVEISAQAMVEQIAADPAQARSKFQDHWFRVSGIVTSNLPVQDIDGNTFQMIELDSGKKIEFQASFTGKDALPLQPGGAVVFDGHVALCEPGVIMLDRCRVVSYSKK